jgi:hypothetical protein
MTSPHSHTSFRAPIGVLLFALIALMIMVFRPDGAEAAAVQLAANPVPGTEDVAVQVAAPREAAGVSLYVDGTLAQRDHNWPWKFGRGGKIAVGGGRHTVSISARLPRKGDTRRSVVVHTPAKGDNRSTGTTGSSSGSTGSSSSSGSSGSRGTGPSHISESAPVKTPPTKAPPTIPTAPVTETPTTPTTPESGSTIASPSNGLLFSPSYASAGGLGSWDLLQEAAPGRISIAPNPTQPSQTAARFEVQPTDSIGDTSPRAEVGKYLGEKSGEERWYGWETYFPENFPTNYPNQFITFTQWRAVDESEDYTSFMLWGENLELRREGTKWSTKLTKGIWHKFVYHVRWSPDPTVGFIELFYDGQLVLPKTYVRTMGGTVANPVQNYVKQGLYKSEEIPTGVLYQNDFRSGTSFEAVNTSS